MSIEVTVRDTETGESETAMIDNDYVLVVAGSCWLDGIQDYPVKGTRVLTVKGRNPAPASSSPEPTPGEGER